MRYAWDDDLSTLVSDAPQAKRAALANKLEGALNDAFAIITYLVDKAETEELSTHVAVSYTEHDAAFLLNMAERFMRQHGIQNTHPEGTQ